MTPLKVSAITTCGNTMKAHGCVIRANRLYPKNYVGCDECTFPKSLPSPFGCWEVLCIPWASSLQECLSLPGEPCSRTYILSMLKWIPPSESLHIWPHGTVHSDSTLALKLCTDHLHLLHTVSTLRLDLGPVLAGFVSTWHRLELSQRKELQLRKCLHEIQL